MYLLADLTTGYQPTGALYWVLHTLIFSETSMLMQNDFELVTSWICYLGQTADFIVYLFS